MSQLPPDWSRYTDDTGKEYFHNAVTNTTQWEAPTAVGLPQSESFGTSEVYQYRPTNNDLELRERYTPPEAEASVANNGVGVSLSTSLVEPAGKASGGSVPTNDMDGGSQAQGSGGGAFSGFTARSVSTFVHAMSAEDGGAGLSGIFGSVIGYAQQFFDVNTDDVVKRLRLVLLPFGKSNLESDVSDFQAHPDFWGPLWVATTAVLFLAATGNLAQQLENEATFKPDYALVSRAAWMIYGCLVFVPLITRVCLYFAGTSDAVNITQLICVYGYSLTPAIPTSLLCVIVPVEFLRTLIVLTGLAVSLIFVKRNLLPSIVADSPTLKWSLIALICLSEATIYIVYRRTYFNTQYEATHVSH